MELVRGLRLHVLPQHAADHARVVADLVVAVGAAVPRQDRRRQRCAPCSEHLFALLGLRHCDLALRDLEVLELLRLQGMKQHTKRISH